MQKKGLVFTVFIIFGLLLTGCDTGFGSKHTNEPEEYGEWESYLEIPSFLPDSVADYQVNVYSYTLLAYMDICFEIFLDISVTEEQLEKLISDAKAHDGYTERKAYYCDGYFEIVFEDYYESYHGRDDEEVNVGWADIEKIIYNPKTLNIVYVCFHANDTGVYALDEVAYFNRFSINEEDYVANLKDISSTVPVNSEAVLPAKPTYARRQFL